MFLKIKTSRFSVVLALFLGSLLIFCVRLVMIQFSRSRFLSSLAAKQHSYYLKLEPARGLIYDRKMKPLALNVPSFSLYGVPPEIEGRSEVVGDLVALLGLDEAFLKERLSRRKQFVWLARQLDRQKMEEIKRKGHKGLYFIKEPKRSYPNGELASHLIGFAGIDNIGLEGIELLFNAHLMGRPGWTLLLRDAKKRDVMLTDVVEPPRNGYSVVLTIDEVVQYIVEREIDKVFKQTHARGASVVVMDVETGEILGLANRPTFDLNHPQNYPLDARRNRAVTDFFEPGSVFKIVTAAAALDEGKVSIQDKFFCENGEYRIANHTLHDVHPYGWLTFEKVIQFSSNIGTTKVAQKIGPEAIYQYARLFGFGSLTLCGLPGEVSGILRPVADWSKTSIAAVPIGQEVAVTAMQLTAAISTIANGGVFMQPMIVKAIIDERGEVIREFQPQRVRRSMAQSTAETLRGILKGVVEKGTGRRALSKIFNFAGKTGTAQKIDPNGGYSHTKFTASFIGFAPAEDPRIAVVVIVDEPRPYYYGGVVAAPVFKAIAEDVLKVTQLDEDYSRRVPFPQNDNK